MWRVEDTGAGLMHYDQSEDCLFATDGLIRQNKGETRGCDGAEQISPEFRVLWRGALCSELYNVSSMSLDT